MSNPGETKHSLATRLKIAVLSLLALFAPAVACAPTCYKPVLPTETPTPVILCYTEVAPTPTPFDSPISPLPTPTPTSTPEARRYLQERLIAAGRFPENVARELES